MLTCRQESTTLEEVDSVQELVGRLDKIELPNQIISALDDALLQRFLSLRPDDRASRRLENWLATFLDEELRMIQDGAHDQQKLSDVLKGLLGFTRYTKVCWLVRALCGRSLTITDCPANVREVSGVLLEHMGWQAAARHGVGARYVHWNQELLWWGRPSLSEHHRLT